ncbi:MAG: flagellar M-ring protein FliF [Spirochaetes bacterium GWF1_41_5]|nr:MAG: flagellar M-ring protein FliF [Spirochaetes bacterium GWF1_41_5]
MNDRFKEIISRLSEIFKKLSSVQKAVIAVVLLLVAGAFIFTLTYSAKKPGYMLFDKALSPEDYGKVTAAIKKMNITFSTRDDRYIIVDDDETGRRIRMNLAQENALPGGIKGWELFDTQKWTTTDFERDVNLRRSIIGEMTKHLESLEWIEKVKIDISFPQKKLYTDQDREATASVTITPAPNCEEYLKERKVIKGIEKIVAFGIDNLKAENIVISDHRGEVINDFTEDDGMMVYKKGKEKIKIIDQKRRQFESRIAKAFDKYLTESRYEVNVQIEMNFDEKEIKKDEILPIVLVPDNPETPYSELKYTENIPISRKKLTESAKGLGMIPEGPPGVEPNIPPGYKESLDKGLFYNKNEDIENFVNSKQTSSVKHDAYDIDRIAVSVGVDGSWERIYDKNGDPIFQSNTYLRRYVPYPEEDLRKLEDLIKGAIGYNSARGDIVVVKNIMFDRQKEFMEEDARFRQQRNIKSTLIFSLIVLLSLFVLTIMYRAVKREIIRRKRLKEQELARKQQMMRESILRSAEEEMPQEQLSGEDKERMELIEKANKIAAENPEVVAKLLRTWLASE